MKFDSKINPGDPVLVIGSRTSGGQQFVGMVLTAEAYYREGDRIADSFIEGNIPTSLRIASEELWFCSGVGSKLPDRAWRAGFVAFAPKYLMPLPPLPEVEFTEDLEKEKELESC